MVVGPVGSGKTTITKLICEKYFFSQISFAELLREQLKINQGDNEISKPILDSIEKGELVDDTLVNMILTQRLSSKDVHILGFVLDGYPKTLEQINFMEENLGILPSHIFV